MNSKQTFRFNAGVFVRSASLFEMRSAAKRYGLQFSCLEDRGIFSSLYEITLEGDRDRIREYINALDEWIKH